MSDETTAGRFASGLLVQSMWPVAMIAVAAVALPFMLPITVSPIGRVALFASIIAGLVTLVLSALLLFDALLFRLIASHDSETAGTDAVDSFLARTGLKPAPARNRSLAERMAGTRRLLLKQRLAFALFVMAAVVAAFAARG